MYPLCDSRRPQPSNSTCYHSAAVAAFIVITPPLLPPPLLTCMYYTHVQVTINDIVRGKVSWNTDNLGDFVLLRR